MKITKNLGMLLLAIWLIASNLSGLGITALNQILTGQLLAILAIAAGVLILIGR